MSEPNGPRNGGKSQHDAWLGDEAQDAWVAGDARNRVEDDAADAPLDEDEAREAWAEDDPDDVDEAEDDPDDVDEAEDDPDDVDEAEDDWDDDGWDEDDTADEPAPVPAAAFAAPGGDPEAGHGPDPDDEYVAEDEWLADEEWDEEPTYQEGPDRRRMIPAFLIGALPAFLIGALAGMLVLGLVWMTISFATGGGDEGNRGGGDPGASAAGVADERGSGTGPDDGGSAQPSRIDRCRQADAELQAPLRSAAPAMDQWEIHVGAMNKLVVGAISLQQANVFWNQTRVGAQRKVDRFYDATRQLWRQGVDCPSPDRLGHASGALRSCAQRVTADLQALEAARTSMTTWNKHVKDMEMLRMGHLSPAAATQMWLASWHKGLEQLRTYQRTERALAGSGDC